MKLHERSGDDTLDVEGDADFVAWAAKEFREMVLAERKLRTWLAARQQKERSEETQNAVAEARATLIRQWRDELKRIIA